MHCRCMDPIDSPHHVVFTVGFHQTVRLNCGNSCSPLQTGERRCGNASSHRRNNSKLTSDRATVGTDQVSLGLARSLLKANQHRNPGSILRGIQTNSLQGKCRCQQKWPS